MDAGIINCALYEDGSEYLGIANITLPNTSNKKLNINGVGIAGDIDMPVPGHRDAMTVSIAFTDAPESQYKLCEMRRHILDLREAHENYNAAAGGIGIKAHKRILEVIPTSQTGGTSAPATAQGASGEYSLLSYKEYIDGKLVRHIDPINFIDIDYSGKDNLAAVRSALGK